MTAKDLAIVVKGMAPVVSEIVKAAVDHAVAPYVARLAVLETKEAATVYHGKDGLPGQKGLDGAQGPEGPAGPAGSPGARGERGEAGIAGTVGERGPEGPEGKPGRDGRDGMTVQGPAGEKGLDGKDGVGTAGRDGRDGSLENLKAMFDGERTVTLCFKDGRAIEGGVIRFPVPIYRGVFVEGKTYEPADTVTWAGSTWVANTETTLKPGEGTKAWTLIVKRGRDGKDGQDGGPAPVPPVVKV